MSQIILNIPDEKTDEFKKEFFKINPIPRDNMTDRDNPVPQARDEKWESGPDAGTVSIGSYQNRRQQVLSLCWKRPNLMVL